MLRGSGLLYLTQVESGPHAKFPGGSSVSHKDDYPPEHEVPVFASSI